MTSATQLANANGKLYGVELVMNKFLGLPLGGLVIGLSVPLALGSSAAGHSLAAIVGFRSSDGPWASDSLRS